MAKLQNLFADVPANSPDEVLQALQQTPNLRIERIVSYGHASPPGFWYDQESPEWVLLVSGAARLQFEDQEPFAMTAGSFINIPAHQRHRVAWTDPNRPTIWLAVYYSP